MQSDPNAQTTTDESEGQTDPASSAELAAPDNPPTPVEVGTVDAAGGAAGELDAMRDRHLRLAAEYDNFRRRTERERTEGAARAQGELVGRLLDALDDLQRFAHQDPERVTSATLLDAAQAVERKLIRALETAGLERVEAEGQPFDPAVHEAITTAPTEQPELDNQVADVFQAGYRFRGTLLRPARVRVHRHGG